MKKNPRKHIIALSFLLALFALSAGTASANQRRPDLRVQMQGPSSAFVNSPYVYTVNVRNIGNTTAAGVKVIIEFPQTDTSPQKYILGTLSGIDNRCQIVTRKLQCSLNNVPVNQQGVSFTFNFTLPVSTKVLEIKATASTTTTPGDPNLGNNTVTLTPSLSYATNQLLSTVNVLNSHCTGQGLTSYFECELFQSSISHHTATLNVGGTVSFPFSGYSGTWYQQTPQQLYFNYTDGNNVMILEFNGYATSPTCFEGMVKFIPSSNYISPYKVCIQ